MKKASTAVMMVLRGLAMGIAEVIPGVSGGTIAFITGIYERLLRAIKSVDLKMVKHVTALRFKDAYHHVDGGFLSMLVLGMAIGVVSGVFGITHILEIRPDILWGFFFGLILASVWAIGKDVDRSEWLNILLFFAGAAVAFYIIWMYPMTGSKHPVYVFLSGSIAICALILPGISGSFILLLLGMYTVIIPTLKDLLVHARISDLVLIVIFAAGCLTGLLSFARLMSWLLKHYKQQMLALLTGFMLGSLPKIWPWRNPTLWMDANGALHDGIPALHDGVRIIHETLVLPAAYYRHDSAWAVYIACAAGILLVILLARSAPSGIAGKDNR